jgi:hypothetical protein
VRFWEHTITQVNNQPEGWFELAYVSFNWFEACSWILISAYLLWRFCKYRRTPLEVGYALYVFLFGLSDVVEVYQLTIGLFVIKAVLLVSILICRSKVAKAYVNEGFKI